MVKSAVGYTIGSVDVRIDMDQPDRPVGTDRLQDRIGDGMVAACGYWATSADATQTETNRISPRRVSRSSLPGDRFAITPIWYREARR